MKDDRPLVDIAILSYNHGKYIKQTIQSVIDQKTDYSFRILLYDDNSSDNSVDIIIELQKKYPQTLCLIPSVKSNIGPLESGKILFSYLTADYIAFLDADDYWSNPYKLQTQIDFLEASPEYGGCFHDAEIVSSINPEDDKTTNRSQSVFKTYSQFNHYKSDLFPEDLIKRTIIPTASLIFRRKNLLPVLDAQTDYLSLFWILQLEMIKRSKFRYFNDCWSVYRDHPEGFSKKHGLIRFKNQHIKVLKHLLTDEYYRDFKADIFESIVLEYYNLILAVKHEKTDYDNLGKYIKEYERFSRLAIKNRVKEFKILHELC